MFRVLVERLLELLKDRFKVFAIAGRDSFIAECILDRNPIDQELVRVIG